MTLGRIQFIVSSSEVYSALVLLKWSRTRIHEAGKFYSSASSEPCIRFLALSQQRTKLGTLATEVIVSQFWRLEV